MWYLQKPTKKELDDYVEYMSDKVKSTTDYDEFKPYLECEIFGHRYDFVKILLRSEPQYHMALNRFLMNRICNNGNQAEAKKNDLKKVFNYQSFISADKDFSYRLSNLKKTNACPYCNRQYTLTIETESDGVITHIARPHFDHWYGKAIYPLLALSFYNLIPSCAVCNSSIKGSDFMDVATHVHPYCQKFGYEPQFKFKVLFTGDNDFMLYTTKSPSPQEEAMKKAFCIEECYRYHEKLEAKDVVSLAVQRPDIHQQSIINDILAALKHKVSSDELIRRIFGIEIEAARQNDRPMSKLKKDLLEQFHVI